MIKSLLLLAAVAAIVAIGCQKSEETAAAGSPPPAASSVSYAQVQEVFNKNCAGCHGAQRPKEGISLVDYASVTKGGKHGPIVVPGNPSTSLLIQTLRAKDGKPQMPPKGPLPEDQIKLVEDWVQAGAKA